MVEEKQGLGCAQDGVPFGCEPEVAHNVYRSLRLGSARLAFAQACGVPLVPFSIRIEADFPDVSTTLVPNTGNTIKIVQDTFIEEIDWQIQPQNPPEGQDSLINFFFQYVSGIVVRLKTIAGGTGYNPVPDFTPISLISRKFDRDERWLLTYDNGLSMDFQASVSPLPFPLVATVIFKGMTSYFPKIIDMSQLEAVQKLKQMGYLCEQYERLYC